MWVWEWRRVVWEWRRVVVHLCDRRRRVQALDIFPPPRDVRPAGGDELRAERRVRAQRHPHRRVAEADRRPRHRRAHGEVAVEEAYAVGRKAHEETAKKIWNQ